MDRIRKNIREMYENMNSLLDQSIRAWSRREKSGCELSVLERIERNVLSGSGMWKEWGTKGWL